jgi:hypothetical protein
MINTQPQHQTLKRRGFTYEAYNTLDELFHEITADANSGIILNVDGKLVCRLSDITNDHFNRVKQYLEDGKTLSFQDRGGDGLYYYNEVDKKFGQEFYTRTTTRKV